MLYTRTRYGAIPRKDWGGTLTGAGSGLKMGAGIGMAFGPVGGAIGGAIGAIGGAIFGNRAENKRDREQRRQDQIIALAKADEKRRADLLNKKILRENDSAYLSTVSMNDSSSLFMRRGGRLGEPTKSGSRLVSSNPRYSKPTPHKSNPNFTPLTDFDAKNYSEDQLVRIQGKRRSTMNKGKTQIYLRNIIEPEIPITVPVMPSSVPQSIKGSFYKQDENGNWVFDKVDNEYIIEKRKAFGGKVTGIPLGNRNKLITTKSGSTSGSHETGQNIPIKRNNRIVAIAEPGEVLVNDKDISKTPFVLSKRLGFAQQFMALENRKGKHNNDIIEEKQSKIVNMNNRLAGKSRYAGNGLDLTRLLGNTNFGLQKSNNMLVKNPGKGYSGAGFSDIGTERLGNWKGDVGNFIKGKADVIGKGFSVAGDVLGTAGNMIMSNKVLKRQKSLIKNSLDEALNYTPTYKKNYLLDENVNVEDQVSSVNKGYSSVTSGLEGLDPALVSALKNNANMNRTTQLNSIYGNKNRLVKTIHNQNVMGIAQTNSENIELTNQTALMKLNAKIAANESLGDLESQRLANVQGAMSEFNAIRRDKQMLDSLKSRWKDSIGNSFEYKYGGKIRRKKRIC